MASGATCGRSMRAVDTNLIVRLITRDHAKQTAAAEAFVAPGAWVSHVVLVDAVWVLTSVYDRSPAEIAATIDVLLTHEHLTLQDAEIVVLALSLFRQQPAVAFSDCLVVELARKAGHVPVGTFDHTLARVEGAQRP
jgi:predicted nucleic-acid-binding protein